MANSVRAKIEQALLVSVKGVLSFFDGHEFFFPRTERRGYPRDAHPMRTEEDEWFESQVRPLLTLVPHLVNSKHSGSYDLYIEHVVRSIVDSVLKRIERNFNFGSYNLKGQALMEFCYLALCVETLASNSILIVDDLSTYASICEDAAKSSVPMNTNWIWVKLYLSLVSQKYSKTTVKTDFEALEALYRSDGWYADELNGKPVFDYYAGWSYYWWPFHALKLDCLKNEQVQELLKIVSRFPEFIRSYGALFDRKGRAVPLGRSGIYRHAVTAPFVASAFLNSPTLTKDWFSTLTCLNLVEEINAPDYWQVYGTDAKIPSLKGHTVDLYSCDASPLWSSKTYWCLCLPESNVFWKERTAHTADWLTDVTTDFGLSIVNGDYRSVRFDQTVVFPNETEPDPRYKVNYQGLI